MDFNKKWNELLINSTSKGTNSYINKEQAKSYYLSINIKDDGILRANNLDVEKDYTCLDIGSGPGIISVPLAKRIKKVTALEPSNSMIEFLDIYKEEENVDNIDTIISRWEDINIDDIKKYDIVIASYSLNMFNIKDELIKMNNISTKKVYLYWFAGTPSWEKLKLDLYPIIKNEEFKGNPKSDLIYQILYELGIYADIKILKGTHFSREFDNIELAIKDLRNRIGISTLSYDDILEDYIHNNYLYKNNKYIFEDRTNYVQISWDSISEEDIIR